MPCHGPQISKTQLEAAQQDVLDLLRSKYKIFDGNPFRPYIDKQEGSFTIKQKVSEDDLEERAGIVEDLFAAIEDMFRQQSYEDF